MLKKKTRLAPNSKNNQNFKKQKIPFLEFHATTLHAKFHYCSFIGVTCSDVTNKATNKHTSEFRNTPNINLDIDVSTYIIDIDISTSTSTSTRYNVSVD